MHSMERVDFVVVIIILAAAALAMVVLFNLSNINITERQDVYKRQGECRLVGLDAAVAPVEVNAEQHDQNEQVAPEMMFSSLSRHGNSNL